MAFDVLIEGIALHGLLSLIKMFGALNYILYMHFGTD